MKRMLLAVCFLLFVQVSFVLGQDREPEEVTPSYNPPAVMGYQWEFTALEQMKIHFDFLLPQRGRNYKPTALETALGQIKGVSSVNVEQYDISFHKGELFDWEDIGPEVLAVFKQQFPSSEMHALRPTKYSSTTKNCYDEKKPATVLFKYAF